MTIASIVNPDLLSHGTLECSDTPATRRFLTEFLGIDVVRPLPEAQYLSKGGPWTVVCVHVDGEQKEQGPQNRFKLAVASAGDVDAAHAAATAHKDEYGIRQVKSVEERNGLRSFCLQDMNKVWWEITNLTQKHYDDAFARGDYRQ
ncbi:MAG TPA: VOC family protein [Xanthobacteraceae bacterium]|nr:VOC family protein [Xanthobacteraceae bacterium]